MPVPAIALEVLPAGYGDCLLVTCPVGRRTWRLLVDTGPDETYPSLKACLAKLPADQNGKRHIDLFIVTHIDHDHIGGVAQLLNDSSLGLTFGDIWFNAPPQPPVRGVAEGEALAQILAGAKRVLPWNVAWSGRPVSTPAEAGGVELTGPGLPRITLLSPTPERLQDLYKVWAKELERLRRKERDISEPEPAVARGEVPNLEALAARVTPTDKAVANGSSIAMLVEHKGASVLLGADAFPTVLVPALNALSTRRGLPGPLAVDVVKLSHHGSRANVTQGLMRAVQAKHYLFSTNGAQFQHPNAEAVARVIVGSKQPTLWFNYDTPHTRQWAADALIEKYGYTLRYPTRPGGGVSLELPSRGVRR
jgi:beta-lactamase superfamily II metal-dependent hydrolase